VIERADPSAANLTRPLLAVMVAPRFAADRERPIMKSSPILASLTLALLAAACSPMGEASAPKADPARIVDAIKTDEVHWNADWKSGDANKVAAHYAPGAIVMVPGGAPVTGPAITSGIQAALNDPGFVLTFASDKVEVSASGDLAVTHGAYTQTDTDPNTKSPVTTSGSFVTVYKPQADGTWKAVWDITTPGAPAAAPAAKPPT
jgi:ketosteroid isomerase-like protein